MNMLRCSVFNMLYTNEFVSISASPPIEAPLCFCVTNMLIAN